MDRSTEKKEKKAEHRNQAVRSERTPKRLAAGSLSLRGPPSRCIVCISFSCFAKRSWELLSTVVVMSIHLSTCRHGVRREGWTTDANLDRPHSRVLFLCLSFNFFCLLPWRSRLPGFRETIPNGCVTSSEARSLLGPVHLSDFSVYAPLVRKYDSSFLPSFSSFFFYCLSLFWANTYRL